MIKRCDNCYNNFTWWDIQKSSIDFYENLKCKKCNTSYKIVDNHIVINRLIILLLGFVILFITDAINLNILSIIMILNLLLEPYFVRFEKFDTK